MSQDPSLKYNLNLVSDKGIRVEDYTSYRLSHSKEILFFETKTERFEISSQQGSETFRFSKIKSPLVLNLEKLEELNEVKQLPLTSEFVQVLKENLKWEDFKWGKDSVEVKGEKYFILNLNFYKIKP
jgi:CRISPR/Cas system endoribonuclease Cas6 (RAMP superfamily)